MKLVGTLALTLFIEWSHQVKLDVAVSLLGSAFVTSSSFLDRTRWDLEARDSLRLADCMKFLGLPVSV